MCDKIKSFPFIGVGGPEDSVLKKLICIATVLFGSPSIIRIESPSEDHIPTIILLSALTILRICNFLLSLNISRMQLERLLSYILHIANCLLFAASLEAVL